MATFAKNTFNAAQYAAARPHYPQSLFNTILSYHRTGALPEGRQVNKVPGRTSLAIDLGCGTGQATVALTDFTRVLGLDPSQKMIEGAKSYAASLDVGQGTKFEFIQSPAEDLSFLENESVDLLIGAQAAHWFDWQKLWPEIGRVLQRGGSAAFWIYSEFRLPDYPSLTASITQYAQGTDPKESLGPHWQRPGRTILERHLVDVPDPRETLNREDIDVFASDGNLERLYFTGSYYAGELPQDSTFGIISQSQTTWKGLLEYLYTWSSLHNYHEKYPEDHRRSFKFGGEGNIAENFWKRILLAAEQESGRKILVEQDTLKIDWPIALIMTHKA